MIEIYVKAYGEKIADHLKLSHTTLVENAVVIRRLEEIKQKLLKKQYESELEVHDDEE